MVLMNPLILTGRTMVTFTEVGLLSTEKIYAKVPAGTLWTHVEREGEVKGAVLYGDLSYAADIIKETDEGAMGASYKGEIHGHKLYIGGTQLAEYSEEADAKAVMDHGFTTINDYITQSDMYLEPYNQNQFNDKEKTMRLPGEGIIFWTEENEKCFLLAGEDSTGLIQGKKVHILNKESLVFVDRGTVVIHNPDGNNLVVDRDGIREPEELRNLGKTISKAFKKSFKNIRTNYR